MPGTPPADAPRERASEDDPAFLARLRRGDEEAYLDLVTRHRAPMVRVALLHCPRRDAAEEVVQDTWLAVFEGIGAFEGRSTLRTWIYSILLNRAKTRGAREARQVPLTDLEPPAGADESGLDAGSFQGDDGPYPGHWTRRPRDWTESPRWCGDAPDRGLIAAELRDVIDAAIAALPPLQRTVVTLRDVLEMTSEEARNALGLSETNLRVILHRGRARVRRAIEAYLHGEAGP
jgi:RNA polymerase sigma-70 factor (ECF subfamily)